MTTAQVEAGWDVNLVGSPPMLVTVSDLPLDSSQECSEPLLTVL